MKRAFLISLFTMAVMSSPMAQQINHSETVTITFDQTPLKQALDSIAAVFDVRISYSDSKINSSRLISGTYTAITQEEFLRVFLTTHELDFTLIDQQVVVYPFNNNQTIAVSGSVVNAEDGTPVAFASITLPDFTNGTSTNEDGEFELEVTELPAQVIVSHLAYEKKTVFIYDGQSQLNISLQQAPRQLKELTIKSSGNKNAYYQIVKNASIRVSKSLDEALYGKAFYRQKSERQDRYTEIFEMFYDVCYTLNGINEWAVQEGRYAFQNKDEYDVFLYNKNFTQLSRMFSLLQPKTESYLLPLRQDVKNFFELSLHEVIEYEGRHIVVINYSPLPSVDKLAAKGRLFIDYETSEVFKMTGTFTDPSMNIIGFSDKESSWNNYQLSFDISFSDNDGGALLLDYIRVDHSFDYYFRKGFVGNIHTSSFLRMYEHYVPATAKKLGGPIDFKHSDAEIIDRIGYNREFWLQNPVVKRTPLEDKLILDFDNNTAFGVVFMNEKDEVILLPDRKNSEKAKKIIDKYESVTTVAEQHKVFLRMDKNANQPMEEIKFSGYIVDAWSLRPSVTGSVLRVELHMGGQTATTKSFDISNGAAYGEIELSDSTTPGIYEVQAYINTDTTCLFSKQIAILPAPGKLSKPHEAAINAPATRVIIAAEGGFFLSDMNTKVVVAAIGNHGEKIVSDWVVVDESGESVAALKTDSTGIGVCFMTPRSGNHYFLRQSNVSNTHSWPFSEVVKDGYSLVVSEQSQNSLRLDIRQKPVFPREMFVLSASGGKVFSAYEKKLTGTSTVIELPAQHLPAGINDLILTDAHGKILATRQVFIDPPKLHVEYISASWKSRKNNRLELTFKITNSDGEAIQANLSAIGGVLSTSEFDDNDISSELLLSYLSDSDPLVRGIYEVGQPSSEDNLLILSQPFTKPLATSGDLSLHLSDKNPGDFSNPLVMEVSVQGRTESNPINGGYKKENQKDSMKPKTFWLPKILINQDGIATIDCNAISGSKLYVSIQGLSSKGEIANFTTTIDLMNIRDTGHKKQQLKNRDQ